MANAYSSGEYVSHNAMNGLVAALNSRGVVNGLAATLTSAITITMAAGQYNADSLTSGDPLPIRLQKSTTTALTFTGNTDTILPRRDIITGNYAGTLAITVGTPGPAVPGGKVGAYAELPLGPDTPARSILLYELWVPADCDDATECTLIDRRAYVDPSKAGYSFFQTDVAATQTAVALSVLGLAGNTEYAMIRPGSVTGISIAMNDARTAGSLYVVPTIDGVSIALMASINGTYPQYAKMTQAIGTETFIAMQRIGAKITTDGSWAPITSDMVVIIEVET